MRQQSVVFLQFDFFKKLIEEASKPFLSVHAKEYLSFLYDLLFTKSKIYIDKTSSEILELRTSETQDLITFQFKKLANLNVIEPLKHSISKYIEDVSLFEGSNLPDYILIDVDITKAKDLNKELGIPVHSSDFDKIPLSFYSVQIFDIEANKAVRIKDCFDSLPKASCLIVEDPYLYSESEAFLKEFLEQLICSQIKRCPFEVLLVIQGTRFIEERERQRYEDGLKRIEKVREQLEEEYGEKIRFNILLNNVRKMHDRHILTNTFWLSSGHSFKAKYNTNTSWIIKPLAKYYPKYRKRVEFATEPLKSSRFPIKHQLLNII
jgi:hypothetical protein